MTAPGILIKSYLLLDEAVEEKVDINPAGIPLEEALKIQKALQLSPVIASEPIETTFERWERELQGRVKI